jgi:hypothetical protein
LSQTVEQKWDMMNRLVWPGVFFSFTIMGKLNRKRRLSPLLSSSQCVRSRGVL